VIVVDTSVWIDVLNERRSPQAARCIELIEGGEPIAAPCVRTGAPLLLADADFDQLATCTPLRLYV
jgi:predicted nucleic acid-binding protein